jgi:hypothetical protein
MRLRSFEASSMLNELSVLFFVSVATTAGVADEIVPWVVL